MSDNALIAPVLLPSGSLHFSAVKADSIVQDVIKALTQLEDVQEDVLGDWECNEWAVQKLRKEPPGRPWEELELESLSDGGSYLSAIRLLLMTSILGILPGDARVQPFLTPPEPKTLKARHFSSFPLTSHLHTPFLRLVSLHPHLVISLKFLRVPEIHDGFTWKIFLARNTTAEEILDTVTDELGLTRVLEGPGGGTIDYVIEDVWGTPENEGE